MRNLLFFLFTISVLPSCEEKCEINHQSPHYYTYTGTIAATNNSSILSYDDRILICGNMQTESIVFKIEKDGDIVWRSICDAHETTLLTGLAEHTDQTIFVCGVTKRNNPEESSDILLIQLQANGDTMWSKTYDVGNSVRGSRIVCSKDQNILIASTTEDPVSNSFSDYSIVKTDRDGNELWRRSNHGKPR